MKPQLLKPRPISAQAFLPFGQVIDLTTAQQMSINAGTTTRYHDLCTVETGGQHAHTLVNLFRAQPRLLPIDITMMERHPLGSQAFIAMHRRPWLVAVAQDDGGKPGPPLVFLVTGDAQVVGVNYHSNVWHHPLLALDDESDFVVVDRGGEGTNLEEYDYPGAYRIESLDAG